MPFSILPSVHNEGCYKIHSYKIYCYKYHRDIFGDTIHHLSVSALENPIESQYLVYFYLLAIVFLLALATRS